MKIRREIFTIFLAVLVAAGNSFGVRRIDVGSTSSGAPAVAVNKAGLVLVVWVQDVNKDGNAGTLYYSVFKDGDWSTPKNVGITLNLAWTPQLDIDSKGRFHLAYADGASRLNREIYHAVYDPDTGWSNATMIWNSPENSAWHKIDVNEDIVHIVWYHEHVDPYKGEDIVMQYKGVDEQDWLGLYERISYTAHEKSIHPAFKVRNGRVYVCYMEGVDLKLPWRIFYQEADRGSNWINVPREKLADLGYYPEMDVDEQGDVHIVWSNKTGNFTYRQRVNGNWRAPEIISNKFAPLQFGDIRYKNNLLVATWVQNDALGTSTYYSKKSKKGEWDLPVQIDQGTAAYAPRVWLDDNGYAHFVWEDSRKIYYERISMPIPDPFIQLSTNSLSFTVEGANPEPETFTVKNIGEKGLNYTISTDQDWLSVTPVSGQLDKEEEHEIQVTVDAMELDEGTYTGTIEISSPQAVNSPQQVIVTLEVLAPPIYPPLNFKGEVIENMALFYREYLHKLSWEANPQNRDITHYRLYEIDGVNTILLEEFDASTFEYTRRHINPNKVYNYELWAVDKKGRTGTEPATLTLGSAGGAKTNSQVSVKSDWKK
ncbi:MAG: hypothetical protein ACE5LV_00140 [Candidatus Aminicenantales bacterium]